MYNFLNKFLVTFTQKVYFWHFFFNKSMKRHKQVLDKAWLDATIFRARVGYLVHNRKIGSVCDRYAVYGRMFILRWLFLKIDVNVFVVNCHFYQWISGVNHTENKRFCVSLMNSLREIVNYFYSVWTLPMQFMIDFFGGRIRS